MNTQPLRYDIILFGDRPTSRRKTRSRTQEKTPSVYDHDRKRHETFCFAKKARGSLTKNPHFDMIFSL